ncbi:DUF554 domain-containing protein [Pelosinus sp. sgz500959]|uniref:DUF554 domain-containing protein n=1 Tax=Pelosinus sp. sgz500959 TaxID=3242472 RepID=UPI00366EA81D
MKGTLVNFVGIVCGSLIGLLLKKNVPVKYQQTVMQGLSLSIGLIGLQMALKTQNILIIIISIVIGGLIGEFMDIDRCLNRVGQWLTMKMGNKYGSVGEGFITGSLVFCVGAMAIVGSIQDGLTGDASTLYAKSMLDAVASVVFASGMGIGVALSSISVLLYQGTLTLLASSLSGFISEAMIREMTAVGGLLIIGISLLVLEIKTIKVANLLPAVPVAAVIVLLWS